MALQYSLSTEGHDGDRSIDEILLTMISDIIWTPIKPRGFRGCQDVTSVKAEKKQRRWYQRMY